MEDDDSSAVLSEPKRPVLGSPGSMQPPNTSVTFKEAQRVPTATSAASQWSEVDLFVGHLEPQPGTVSHAVQEKPLNRKRKEMEEEIQMDELESLMSEDVFDEEPADKSHQPQPATLSLTERKQASQSDLSASKRQRVHLGENGSSRTPQGCSTNDSASQKNNSKENRQHIVSIKTEPAFSPESRTVHQESSKPFRASSANTGQNIIPFEANDDASFIEVKIRFQFVLLFIP